MMKDRSGRISSVDRVASLVIWGISAATFLLMLFAGWQRWADVLIDFGRELYVPWQICQGRFLYIDIFYFYGPLAAYWDALLFLIFGVQAKTLIYFNLCLLGLLVILFYRLVSIMSCKFTASLVIFAFVSFFSLAHYSFIGNYNYICPYSNALVYGLALSMATLLTLKYYWDQPRKSKIFFLGLLAGLTLLSKIELAAALIGAIMTVYCIKCVAEPGAGNGLFKLGVVFLGFLSPVVLFFFYFALSFGPMRALDALSYPLKGSLSPGVIGNPFVRGMSGLDNLADSLQRVGFVSLAYLAVFLIALACSWAITFLRGELSKRLGRLVFVLIFLLLFVALTKRIDWNSVFLPLPLFCILFSGVSFWFVQQKKRHINWALLRLAFGILALIMLGKILFKAHIFHYGFVLALPAFLTMLIFLLYDLPAFLPLKYFDVRAFQVITISLMIYFGCVHMGFSLKLYSLKTFSVGTDKGRFITYDRKYSLMGPVLEDVISYLKGVLKPNDTLAVMPEGVMLNFLLQATNPTPYYDLIPTTVALESEEKILNAFERSPPVYVIVLERDMSEYGARYFGRDYAKKIYGWVASHYRLIYRSGAPPSTGKGFGAFILRRID